MRTLREVGARQLRWINKARCPYEFELRGDECVLATLQWKKQGGSLATAQVGDHRWTFKRSGFLTPKVRVRMDGSETDIAVMHANSIGEGILDGPEGRRYRWSSQSFWRSEWTFSGSGGELVFRLKPSFSTRKPIADVDIAPGAVSLPDLELLVALGWYVLVLVSLDAGWEPAASDSVFE